MSLRGRPARLVRRLAFRPYAPLGPALLYLIVAVGMISPFWSRHFRGAGDLFTAIGTIVEADNALREGQFPIRVAPAQLSGARYPFFQFYGNFPFTAAGIIRHVLPGHDPYLAWKVATVLALAAGGFFTWRLCRRLTRRGLPAVLAGAAFMTAPYMFADFVGRGAFTELVAFNLLPAVLFYAWRAFASPGAGNICRSAVAWALLGMSHNITYLYAMTFFGLWFLSCAPITRIGAMRRYVRRMARLVVAGVVHGSLVAWYLAPQVMLMKSLRIGTQNVNPFVWNYLTTLRSLLSPSAYTVPMSIDSVTPFLTAQVGVPVMLAVLGAFATIVWPSRLGVRKRMMVLRALVLCVVAFLLAWAPVNFWRWLPAVFGFVQFPYRLLMFVTLFGSIAGACVLAWLLRLRGRWAAALAFVVLGACVSTYVPRGGSYDPLAIPGQVAEPRISGLEDYQLSALATTESSLAYPGLNYASAEFNFNQDGKVRRPAEFFVPVYDRTPDVLEIDGSLPRDDPPAEKLVVVLDGRRQEFRLTEPHFSLRVPVESLAAGAPSRLIVSPENMAGRFATAYIHRLEFKFSNLVVVTSPTATVGVPARAMKSLTTPGLHTRVLPHTTAAASIVTLPVLYYPGLLRVAVDGAVVEPAHVGRYVALRLPPGRHEADIEFVGVRWANGVSLVGWVGVITVPFIRRRQRNRAARSATADASAAALRGARFNLFDALLAVAALLVGVMLVKGYPYAAKYFDGSVRFTASADVNLDDGHQAAYAFDGDPETAWVVPPGAASPTVTIRPHKASVLRRIELESRETSLWECWQTVRVVLKRNGNVVLDRVFPMPGAGQGPVQTIEVGRQRADLVELHFSDPVTTTKNGRQIDAGLVSPGYREIRLDWARK